MPARLSAISLIFLLIVPILGTVGWLKLRKYQVRGQVKQMILSGVDKSQLTRFSFSESENEKLLWEDDHEFEYQGQMYDVVEVEMEDGDYIYWCWHDTEEADISQQLTLLTEKAFGNDTQQQQESKRLHEFLNHLFFPVSREFLSRQNKETSLEEIRHCLIYSNVVLPTIGPPPKA